MLSKFNAKINKSEIDSNSWAISVATHFVLGLCVIWLVYGPKNDSVDFTVLEAPVQAPAAAKIPQIQKKVEQDKPKDKPNAVFGASRKSVTSSEGESAKAGNTVAKAPDNKTLKETDPDALPIPADEILVTRMPRLSTEVRIPYPPEAKKNKIQGAVVMDLLIDALGNVREAKLVSGPGFGLNEAAMEAIQKFKFEPAVIQDKAVAVRIRYAYRFELER